jgi:hypothetical protein
MHSEHDGCKLCDCETNQGDVIKYGELLHEKLALQRKLDFTIDVFHEIIAGKPGVNLSNNYLRGRDIGLAEEALSVLEGITAIAISGRKSENASQKQE